MGSGRVTFSSFFLASKIAAPFAFHANIGYIRNENANNENKNLWHVSASGEVKVVKDLKVVADVGIEPGGSESTIARNFDHPAFILGGMVYSLTKSIAINCGIKFGLNSVETDMTVLTGISLNF